jgi:uncharacterized protein HemX
MGAGMGAGAETPVEQVRDADTSDGTARWLAGAGLLVGALGLGVGGGAVLRTRRTATTSATPASERERSEATR